MLGATDSLEIMEICDIFWRKNLCDLLIVWMWEMKEKMIFKAFTWLTKLWRMMDVFILSCGDVYTYVKTSDLYTLSMYSLLYVKLAQ